MKGRWRLLPVKRSHRQGTLHRLIVRILRFGAHLARLSKVRTLRVEAYLSCCSLVSDMSWSLPFWSVLCLAVLSFVCEVSFIFCFWSNRLPGIVYLRPLNIFWTHTTYSRVFQVIVGGEYDKIQKCLYWVLYMSTNFGLWHSCASHFYSWSNRRIGHWKIPRFIWRFDDLIRCSDCTHSVERYVILYLTYLQYMFSGFYYLLARPATSWSTCRRYRRFRNRWPQNKIIYTAHQLPIQPRNPLQTRIRHAQVLLRAVQHDFQRVT